MVSDKTTHRAFIIHKLYKLEKFVFSLSHHSIFYMRIIRSNLAYLCPNMIHANVVDLSERRSEEVISFLRRSVYEACPSISKGLGDNQCYCVTFDLRLQ